MAAIGLTLRVKSKDGQHVVKQLTLESTVQELQEKLTDLTKIPKSSLKVLQGFPPKPLDLKNEQETLKNINLKSGDTLIVQEDMAAKVVKQEQDAERILQEIELQKHTAGFLSRFVVPADNSCLFTSVNFVLEGNGQLDITCSHSMRQLIAGIVMSDPDYYNEAFLGKSNGQYRQWISNKDSWGGAIEISILSQYYSVEIDVIDTKTGRIDRFGEDKSYTHRVLLIYDGVHYDPLLLEMSDGAKVTKFLIEDEHILSMALELAAEAKASRNYTDVNKFALKCLICQKGLVGQKEAQDHAKATGHVNFGEF